MSKYLGYYFAVFLSIFLFSLSEIVPPIVGQEKVRLDLDCVQCNEDTEYLIKVWNPVDNYKLIGEKKFLG
jgi:hypothetical protein